MARWIVVLAGAVCALAACTRVEPGGTSPLPSRQTTIDPVNAKLDAAREDADRRRRDIDDAAK